MMPGTPDQSLAAVIRLALFQFCENGIDCAVLSAPTVVKDRHTSTARNATRAYVPRVEELRCMRPRLFAGIASRSGRKRVWRLAISIIHTRAGIANAGTGMQDELPVRVIRGGREVRSLGARSHPDYAL